MGSHALLNGGLDLSRYDSDPSDSEQELGPKRGQVKNNTVSLGLAPDDGAQDRHETQHGSAGEAVLSCLLSR